MNLAIITLGLIFIVICADVYVWIRYGSGATISDTVVVASKTNPILPWAIGFLFGFLTAHFYFSVCLV